jgi:hypothetical protein
MDRVRRPVTCVAVAAVLLATPAGAQAARLALAGSRPVAVRGSGFHHREHVRLTVRQSDGRRLVRRVTASRSGTFKLTFPSASPPCGSWSASATGSLGSRAILAGMNFPDCIVQ